MPYNNKCRKRKEYVLCRKIDMSVVTIYNMSIMKREAVSMSVFIKGKEHNEMCIYERRRRSVMVITM
jgi:hypothetical protein